MATRSKTKTQARQASADKRPKAIAKYVRISPRKVKIVIDLIRGKNVDEAAAILTYTPKAASPVVLKVLNSAIANAPNSTRFWLGPPAGARGLMKLGLAGSSSRPIWCR